MSIQWKAINQTLGGWIAQISSVKFCCSSISPTFNRQLFTFLKTRRGHLCDERISHTGFWQDFCWTQNINIGCLTRMWRRQEDFLKAPCHLWGCKISPEDWGRVAPGVDWLRKASRERRSLFSFWYCEELKWFKSQMCPVGKLGLTTFIFTGCQVQCFITTQHLRVFNACMRRYPLNIFIV